MLRGRESLKRVIGKRRRFLPNLSTILSLPPPPSPSPSPLNSVKDDVENSKAISKAELNSIDGDDLRFVDSEEKGGDYVTCPLCNNQIRGDDCTVNSHLDLCLVKGTKRKLSQRTLFQLSFCSKLKSSKCVNEEVHAESDVLLDSESLKNELPQLASISSDEVTCTNSATLLQSSSVLGSITQHAENYTEKKIIGDNISEMTDVSSATLGAGAPNFDVEEVFRELAGMALETFIVGRKYVDAAEVVSGANIGFLRDSSNIKDPNAIKVVSPDSDSVRVLGFLPRELAQHLSPLIDKYQLNFEGVITSVPKNSLDIVPIQITCLKPPCYNEVANDDIPMLSSLCFDILPLMKSNKKFQPSTIKYQQNFRLMIEEVLASSVHLFTDAEKCFLESFSLMSDDSQRLFVRLYTRKEHLIRHD